MRFSGKQLFCLKNYVARFVRKSYFSRSEIANISLDMIVLKISNSKRSYLRNHNGPLITCKVLRHVLVAHGDGVLPTWPTI